MIQFLATARMRLREQGYFGWVELAGQYLVRLLRLVALLYIWRVLCSQGADMEGMTLAQLLSYTALSSALGPLLDVRTPLSSWLHEGTLLGLYQRPSSLFGQLTAHTVGGWGMQFMLFTLPVIAVCAIAGIPMRPASAWFYLSLPLAVAQGFAVDFLFACLLIRLNNLEWTMVCIRSALTAMFTGALIPFAALPWGLGEWLSLSPLGTLAGAPLALFSGLDSPARLIPAQILWTCALWPLAAICFARSRERLVSNGG